MIEIEQDTIGTLVNKLLVIEQSISRESGAFVLFALVERDDAPGKWDLIVSAAWAKEDDKKRLLNRIALHVRETLTWEEKLLLSRILILNPKDPFVQAVSAAANVEHNNKFRVQNTFLNGVSIKDAYIITSRRP